MRGFEDLRVVLVHDFAQLGIGFVDLAGARANNQRFGGLVGRLESSARISRSYVAGKIQNSTKNGQIGGVVGSNYLNDLIDNVISNVNGTNVYSISGDQGYENNRITEAYAVEGNKTAYQEILGDMHNLFGDTDSVNVYVRSDGSVEYSGMEEHDTIEDMLRYVHLQPQEVINKFEEKLRWAKLERSEQRIYTAEFFHTLKQSSYLSLEED